MSADFVNMSDTIRVLDLRYQRHRAVVVLGKLDETAEVIVCGTRRRADAASALGREIRCVRGGVDVLHRVNLWQNEPFSAGLQPPGYISPIMWIGYADV